ncbi:MAG: ribonuclease P protein component [Clostridia bacterium]
MLKTHLLKKNRQYAYVYKKGVQVHTANFALIFVKTKLQPFKVGFSISKKVGGAVDRNKIRRRMKMILLDYIQNFLQQNNYVFVAKPPANLLQYAQMKSEVQNILKKANCWIEN